MNKTFQKGEQISVRNKLAKLLSVHKFHNFPEPWLQPLQHNPINPFPFLQQIQIAQQPTPNLLQKMQTPNPYHSPLISTIALITLQLIFYFMPLLMLYWFCCGYWRALALALGVSGLQMWGIKRRSQKYVAFVSKYLRICEYVKIDRTYEQPIGQNESKTLFCYHPHSIYGFGTMLNANHPAYLSQKLSLATPIISNLALMVPLFGLHLRLLGFAGADHSTVKYLMKAGKTVTLVPGGFEEATLTTPAEFRVFVRGREGFLKYAMRYGYSVRQVLLLNEHKVFHTFDHLLSLRLLLNRLKLPGTLFLGKYGLFFPPDQQIPTIIGKELKYRKEYKEGESPTLDEIEEFHQDYMRELGEFYGRWREKNGGVEMRVY